MSHNKIVTPFTVVKQEEQKVNITVPSLHHDKVRATIFQTLLKMREAIEDVSIDVEKNNVTVSYDSQKITTDKLLGIVDAVLNNFSQKPQNKIKEEIRHPLEKNQLVHDIVFKVSGMSCESCALFIEMVLTKEANVVQATIDFTQGMGRVSGYLNEEEIFKIVKRNGYRASSVDIKE